MPDRPPRVLWRDWRGNICEGLNVTHLIDPEQRARLNAACAEVFGMSPTVDLIPMDDLDALPAVAGQSPS